MYKHIPYFIIQNKRRFATFYLPKLFIVGLIWLMAVTLSTWQEFNGLRDPTYNYKTDAGSYLVRKMISFENIQYLAPIHFYGVGGRV